MPALLRLLSLQGTVVTANAPHCQRVTAQQIVDRSDDFALALKGNQGTLHDDVVRFFDNPASKAATAKPVVGAGHGRIETCTATVSTDIGWLQEPHGWPALVAIGMRTGCPCRAWDRFNPSKLDPGRLAASRLEHPSPVEIRPSLVGGLRTAV